MLREKQDSTTNSVLHSESQTSITLSFKKLLARTASTVPELPEDDDPECE
jgi:hypothetical protein